MERQDRTAKKPLIYHFHVGMRMVKTVVAVFLCGVMGLLRNEAPVFSTVAAVLCMQNTAEDTFASGINRTIGTIIGGLFGSVLVLLCLNTWIADHMLVYYLIISVALIPVIVITLIVKRPQVTGLACVVFLSITVSQITEGTPINHAIQRILDTLVGIMVAVAVDLVLPNHQTAEEAPAGPQPSAANQKGVQGEVERTAEQPSTAKDDQDNV